MCGRFVDPNLQSQGSHTGWLKTDPFKGLDEHIRRFNIKPTQDVLIIPPKGWRAFARWGLVPSWHRGTLKDWKAATFNARIEEAKNKTSFRAAWRNGRCLIPAAGYYEWTGEKGAKQPHFIYPAGNEENMWFAGLSSPWRDILTCTIVTRAANETVNTLHSRMPVVLNTEECRAWLAGTDDPETGASARLRHHLVARFGAMEDRPEMLADIFGRA